MFGAENKILELKAQEDKYLNEGIEALEFAHTFKSLIRETKEEEILSIGISNKDTNLMSIVSSPFIFKTIFLRKSCLSMGNYYDSKICFRAESKNGILVRPS